MDLQFSISLSRILDDRIGIGARCYETGLLVTGVRDLSIAAGWNAQNPARQIHVGDLILCVNGSRDVHQMLATIRTADSLDILVSPKDTTQDLVPVQHVKDIVPQSIVDCLPLCCAGDARVSFCAICCEDCESTELLLRLPCRHAFHSRCAGPWLSQHSRRCPLCCREVSVRGLLHVPGGMDTTPAVSERGSEGDDDSPSRNGGTTLSL
ncbi:unnamed protein product [Polarella glacialis]|uniref:RING-type domain-containing protein n=1 Tax=Polarella glacialis TaxID=89957 RepID=A0A813DBQ9_POLGL|nr:unnamed protein product [Polarella glacialis]